MVIAGCLLVGALVAQQVFQKAWQTSVQPLILRLSQNLGFSVQQVYVAGRQKTLQQDLLKAMCVTKQQPIFSVSPKGLRARIEALPWVSQAHVERRLPGTLWIQLREKAFLALWQYQGKLTPIDHEGNIIACSMQEVPSNAIKVVGEKARFQAPHFLEMLNKFPTLQKQAVAAVFLRMGRWDLYLKKGWVLKLPEKEVEEALHRFVALEKKLHVPEKDVVGVDMRFQGTLILNLTQKDPPVGSSKSPKHLQGGKAV